MSSLLEKPSINAILRQLMAEVDITEAELARKTNIPQPTLHRILSGSTKSPRGESLLPLANFFCITINQLIGDEQLPKERIPGTFNPNVHGWTTIPVISWEQAIQWPKLRSQLKKQTWGNWVSTDAIIGPNAFALIVQNDAMAPQFPEGCVLIFDPGYEPQNRDFACILLKSQKVASFKQLFTDGHDTYLKPINPEFKTIQITPEDECRFIGILVQTRMDFRKENWQAIDVVEE